MYAHLALSEDGFLFNTRCGSTYSLNKSGTLILRSLIAGSNRDDTARDLCKHFAVQFPRAQRDIERFLFRLVDLGLTPNVLAEENDLAHPKDQPAQPEKAE